MPDLAIVIRRPEWRLSSLKMAADSGFRVGLVSNSYWATSEEDALENLRPFAGVIELCQGISIGNVLREPLGDICANYDPLTHPIAGPILEGGPAKLSKRYQVPVETHYADACHLCYETRRILRPRFPEILAPDQVYGNVTDEVTSKYIELQGAEPEDDDGFKVTE
jgi:hypothetical protein